MPDDWAALLRNPEATRELGRRWLEKGAQLAMRVPSVICSTDFNLLLNPLHADMARVKVLSTEPFQLDPRLFGQTSE